MTPPEISVILPTHAPNPERLTRTLAGLRRQEFPAEKWEFVIVANASPAPIPPERAQAGHPAGRVVPEPRLGLSYARSCGIAAARGALLVFVDDDNVLEPDYLAVAAELFARLPQVGAAGGVITGEFAVPPPEWARTHLGSLALRDYGGGEFASDFAKKPDQGYPFFAPLGAGLAIRREAAELYRSHLENHGSNITGRAGRALGSAEECELIYRGVLLAGREVAYSSRLRLTHLIPASRLKFRYLARLNYGGGVSWGGFLRLYGIEKKISPLTLPLRIGRVFFRCRAWTRAGFVQWCSLAGRFVGRAF